MRAFRVRQRNPRTNNIVKHRDYIGIENFKKFGLDTYNRYKSYKEYRYSIPQEERKNFIAEVCEKIDGKWKTISIEEFQESVTDTVDSEWLLSKGFENHSSLLIESFSKDISVFDDEYKKIEVSIMPGNVYVYLRQGDTKDILGNWDRSTDDLVTVFNGDVRGKLTRKFLEDLYFLLKGEVL